MVDTEREKKPSERATSFIGTYLHLPPKVFDSVELNTALFRENPDSRLQRWDDIEYMMAHAGVFALGTNYAPDGSKGIKLPRTPTMHRGVVIKLMQTNAPFEDEYGIPYGQIAVKGTGIANSDREYYRGLRNSWDPIGLFGYAHAKQELEMADQFARAGGRTGRVLAVMKINHGKFMDWVGSLDLSNTPYDIETQLKKVEKNGDEMALCVRILGTERFQDYADSPFEDNSKGLYTRSAMLRRSAFLLSHEITQRGEGQFRDKYDLPFSHNYPLSDHLSQIAYGGKSEELLETMCALQVFLWAHNLRVKEVVSKQLYGGKMSMRADPLNFDLAGFVYDWETSKPGTKQFWPNKVNDGVYPAFPLHPVPYSFLNELKVFAKDHYGVALLSSE